MGLFFDPDLKIRNTPDEPEQTQVLSVCNPQSPGKEWNTYVMNDSYTQLFELSGYKFVNDYFVDITQGIGCNAIITAGPCQTCKAASGGNWEACYCTMNDATGLHCPMFGPIYYMNLRILYQLGGVDWMLGMPGSRVKCDQGNEEISCADMCQPKCLCDFSDCNSEYNCTKNEDTGYCSCEKEDGTVFYESTCTGGSYTPVPTSTPTPEGSKSRSKSSKARRKNHKKKNKKDKTEIFD